MCSASYQVSDRDVAILDEHLLGVPVLQFAWQVVAALQQQDALARWRQVIRERATTSAGSNDYHVILVVRGHGDTPPLLE